MLELGLKTLLSYMLGSLSGALIVGKLYGGVDIRTMGSHNAGGTNALRTQGFTFALFVVIIDIAKGALPALLLPGLSIPGIHADPTLSREWLAVACGTAAVAGHVWPMWFGFAGGKGAATLVGVLLVLAPKVLLVVLGVWLVIAVLSGYVGLATMTAVAAGTVYPLIDRTLFSAPLMTFLCAMTLFVIFTHRENIQRMIHGNENRTTKLMLFRRR